MLLYALTYRIYHGLEITLFSRINKTFMSDYGPRFSMIVNNKLKIACTPGITEQQQRKIIRKYVKTEILHARVQLNPHLEGKKFR